LADAAARRPSFPEGSALDYDIAVAVKTGTSQGYRDGWTVAFSDRLLVIMWIGNHDWRRMNHLGGLAGTADAVHAVLATLTPQHKRHVPVPQSFNDPAHSVRHEVCALSGQLAGADCPHRRSEVFLAGTSPTATCPWHRRVGIDSRTGDRSTPACPAHVVRWQTVLDLPPAYARWGRQQGRPLMPLRTSRWCGGDDEHGPPAIALVEPKAGVRYAFDPDTPAAFATIRLAAQVDGTGGGVNDDVVFLVDGDPVARVPFPHETRWTITPGRHTIQAVLAAQSVASAPVVITVRE
jgi:penicillin-binding protein 1C